MNEAPEGTARYEVEAHDAAQVLCRILGLFAQQGRPLASVIAHSTAGRLHAMLRFGEIDVQRASVLAEKIRALTTVESVVFTFSAARVTGLPPRHRLHRAQDAQHVAAGHLADVLG